MKKGHKIVSKSDYESLESELAAEKKKYIATEENWLLKRKELYC